MAYSLKLPPPIQDRIRSYLENLDALNKPRVIQGIADGLKKIADDPSIGTVISTTYNRPVYRHFFKVGDVTYNFQAGYLVDEEDESVTISTFGAIPF